MFMRGKFLISTWVAFAAALLLLVTEAHAGDGAMRLMDSVVRFT